jgi:NTE family protein
MDGDPGETLVLGGDPLALLESSPIFRGLDRPTLSAIAAELESLSLPGGATLFEAGEPPDAMYLLIAGCLGAYAAGESPRLLGRITAGETVGEMGLVSGHPRSATVRALRDSDLVRLPRESFDRVILRHPAAMLRVAQLLVERLESSDRGTSYVGPRTFTLLPQSIEVDVGGFATELVAALGRHGRAELVWSVRGADHTSAWFHRIETANDYVVYVADPEPTTWSKLCVRQADTVLLVARAEAPAGPWPVAAGDLGHLSASARAELVLLHDERIEPGAAARWCRQVPAVPHHHVRGPDDVARVARLLTGKAVGLVLSGGGARGFAHIGVVRALREAGVTIDLVGGTSMGAIMGAGVAAGWSTAEMVERFHRAFVATNPLSDYTLPIVSLVAGRKVSRLLRQEFGEGAIEDLPLPFYAVSANLTTGHGSVHRAGDLWRWLRASVAIPGVLPPVFHQGEVHVDGGAINNMPVDVMRAFHTGVVIGVDVGSDTTFTSDIQDVDLPPLWKLLGWFRRHKQRPTILQILWRAGMVNSEAATVAGRRLTDLLLQPPLADVDLLNWRAFERAIEAGYRHTNERLAALDAGARARLGLPPRG